MQQEKKDKTISIIKMFVIALLFAVTLVLDFVQIPLFEEEFRRRMLTKILQQTCGSIAVVLLMLYLKIKLFGKIENWLYLLPCLAVSVANFQWSAYFGDKMQLVRTEAIDFVLLAVNCLFTGLFEELIFRGIIFSSLLGVFKRDKKGFLTAYLLSCAIFSIFHLLNGFSLGGLLQVGYTFLTGGMFAFCLIETKNIFCCAFIHGLFNFCGLLFDKQGLGSGVVFDVGTVVTMVIVDVLVGIFVLYRLWKYSSEEREYFYDKVGLKKCEEQENHEKNGNE